MCSSFNSYCINIEILFSLDTKVYSALGNHDYHPKSQLPGEPNYIYEQIATLWQDWLNLDSQRTFKKGEENPFWQFYFSFGRITVTESRSKCVCCHCPGGYYTENLLNQTGLRILVLNTNLYYDQNKQILNTEDPAGQLAWSDQVLTEAANNKEKANGLCVVEASNRMLELA